MNYTDMLTVGAEIAFGFAGMAGIIVTLKGDRIRRSEAVGLTNIIYTTFAVGFGALGFMLLMSTELAEEEVWTISSIVIAMMCVVGMTISIVGFRQSSYLKKHYTEILSMYALMFALLVFNILNALGTWFAPNFHVVFASGIAVLGISAYWFSKMLLSSVWHTVNSQEALSDQDRST